MNENEDLPTLAPDLPRKPNPRNQDARGRFKPGNRAAVAPFQPGNTVSTKHGLRGERRKAIDRRRTVDRAAALTVEAIEAKLGPEQMTPQRAVILRNIGRQLRDLGLIEAFELKVGIIDKKNRRAWPIVEAKWKLLENVARQLERLGLDGPKRKATSLADVMIDYGPAARDDGAELEPAGAGAELEPASGAGEAGDPCADGDADAVGATGEADEGGPRPLADRSS